MLCCVPQRRVKLSIYRIQIFAHLRCDVEGHRGSALRVALLVVVAPSDYTDLSQCGRKLGTSDNQRPPQEEGNKHISLRKR